MGKVNINIELTTETTWLIRRVNTELSFFVDTGWNGNWNENT